ncbi:hypothetical protein ATO46_13345 [Aeromonas schubertii]|nr:hypothetical protein ATO46_13345 [Aeromonas schubertii]
MEWFLARGRFSMPSIISIEPIAFAQYAQDSSCGEIGCFIFKKAIYFTASYIRVKGKQDSCRQAAAHYFPIFLFSWI